MSSGRPASSVCCRAVPLIVRGAWLAALIGLPPVLELPGALSCEGLALSFSGLRALAALGLLAGIAFAGRISARPRRALCAVGMVSTAAYCALTATALLKYLAFGASEAIVLGWSAICLVLFGSFACGTVWQHDLGKAETGTAPFSRGLAARFLAFALLALGILGILVGNEPNWTFARLSYSAASGFDASNCWHVLAYSIAGFAGPGPHLLRSGVLDPGPIDAACCLAWCAAGMLAAWLDKRGKSASCLAGMAFGVIAARCLAELAPALFAGRTTVGFAALACGAALIAVSSVREAADHAARPRPAAVEAGPSDDAFDLTPLSPREREAVLGRLAKKSSAEVARQMGVSPSTVRNLQSRAAKKLGVGSLDELLPFQQVAVEPKVPRHCPMAALLPYLIVFGSVLPVGAPLAGGWIEAALAGQILLAFGLGLVAACSGRTKRTAVPQAPLCGVAALLGACSVAEVAGLAQGTLFVFAARAAALAVLALVVASARAAWDCIFAPRDVACISAACLPALLVGGPGAALCSCSFGILTLYVGRKKDACSLATLVASFGLGSAVGAHLSWSLVCTGELLALTGSMAGVAAAASLASLAMGSVVVAGIVSAAALFWACLARRDISRLRGQSIDFGARASALCRLRGLNETCTSVAIALIGGMSGPEICEALLIAPGTLNSARREVFRVFNVHTVAGLDARVARLLGLLEGQ